MNIKKRWGKANDKASTDSKGARAEANQRFVRETLAQRQPQYARMVERVAEAVVRDMAQCRSADGTSVAEEAAKPAEARDALAAA